MSSALRKSSFVLALLSMLSGTAGAQDSMLLGHGANGDALSVTVMARTPTTQTVRIRITYARPQVIAGYSNVLATESVEQIDCRSMTHAVVGYALYTNLALGGAPALTTDVNPSDIKPIAVSLESDSASAAVLRAVCAQTAPHPFAPSQQAQVPAPAPEPPSHSPPYPPQWAPPQTVARPPVYPEDPRLPGQAAQPGTTGQPGPAPAPGPAASPSPAVPPDSGTVVAKYRPFPESSFTLGTMGRLAEYVYFDEATLAFHQATADKISRGKDWVSQDGKPHPLLEAAHQTLGKRYQAYSDALNAKKSFLVQSRLTALPLPKISQAPVSTFRAELYQYAPTRETILVFRGTQGGMDWISNVWAGADLFSIEAPHYRAAYDLVAALAKQQIRPMVVGHSLGGGMAQYVGYKFGLKVVGFNSAPLPERYYSDGEGSDVRTIRLFSAVETVSRPGARTVETHPDPVSITLPNKAVSINQLFPDYEPVRAHQHLVKPICLRTVLDPYYAADEQQAYATMLNHVLSKGMVSAIVGGFIPKPGAVLTDKAMVENIRAHISADMSAPVWRPDSRPDVDNKRVADTVKQAVAQVAIDQYKAAGGFTSAVRGGYKFALGDSWGDMLAGAGTFAAMAGKAALTNTALTGWLFPHSMARFNRAMQANAASDVFQADPDRAQCALPPTTY